MAPRKQKSTGFVWTDDKTDFLLECFQTVSLKNSQLTKKYFHAELRKLFCETYVECKISGPSLYTYACTARKNKKLPEIKVGRSSTWTDEKDNFLIECILRALHENNVAISQGLMAGKRGKHSMYGSLLFNMFAARYPTITSNVVSERAKYLRSKNGIVDVIEETAVNVTDKSTKFFQQAMKYWEYGFRYAAQSLFLAACSRCSSILVRDGVKQMIPYANDDEPIVAQYYSRHHIPLNVSCMRKNVVHWYVCTICKHVDLLTKYPLAPESNTFLPLPKYVAELTNDDRRNISLVALNSTTAKARSDAMRVFQHLKGDLTMRHLNEKQYFQMYAMIVSSVPVSSNRTGVNSGDQLAIKRALKWLKLNNHLYRSFLANFETLLRYKTRQQGQPSTLHVLGNVDFGPASKKQTKSTMLDKEASGLVIPANNVPGRGINVGDTVTGSQHMRDFQMAKRAHTDFTHVQLRDTYLEEKLFPWLFPYGLGEWHSDDKKRVTRGAYVKWRLLMTDERFRREPDFIFFMLDLLIKERLRYYASTKIGVAKLAQPLTKQMIETAQQSKNPYDQYGTEVPTSIPNSRNFFHYCFHLWEEKTFTWGQI